MRAATKYSGSAFADVIYGRARCSIAGSIGDATVHQSSLRRRPIAADVRAKAQEFALPKNAMAITCDMASPFAGLMLHVRARYVSKAAILALSGHTVPAENRSPA